MLFQRAKQSASRIRAAVCEGLEQRRLLSGTIINNGEPTTYSLNIAAADVNGDGNQDLLAVTQISGEFSPPSSGVTLFLANGNGTFQKPVSVFNGSGMDGVAVADLNGDGNPDLIAAEGGANVVDVLLGNGNGTFEQASPYFSGGSPTSIATGDFDGDDKADIVTANANGTIGLLFGNGQGGLSPVQTIPDGLAPSTGSFIQVADINHDSKSDLIVEDLRGDISVMLGNGNGTFQPARAFYVGGGAVAAVTMADINGDDDLLLVRSSGATGPANQVQVLLGNGNGMFGVGQTIVPDPQGKYNIGGIALADLAGDGKEDLLINDVSGSTNRLTVFAGNGDGTFAAGRHVTTFQGTHSYAVTALQVSGQTIPSIVLANAVSPRFVSPFAAAPTITSANNAGFIVGQNSSFTITTAGAPAAALSIVSGTLPSGLTFVDNGDGTATISGTPAAGTAVSYQAYQLTLRARNGVSPRTDQSFTLGVQQPTRFTSANHVTMIAGVAESFPVTTTGSFGTLSIQSGSLPTGLTFADNGNGIGGTLSGTPAAGTGGTYDLTLTSNGVDNPVQAFTLTVDESPKILSADSLPMAMNQPRSFVVSTQGFPYPALSVTDGSLPQGVTFVDQGNGTALISGEPKIAGNYSFTINASNGIGMDAQQPFTITVGPPASPAFSSADNASFLMGTAGSFAVTTTGFPSASILIVSGTLPSGLALVDNKNGTATLSGTPAAGATGTYPLTLRAVNGTSPRTQQSFTLMVTQAPIINDGNPPGFTLLPGVESSFTVATSAYPAAALTLVGGTLPPGYTFVDNGNGTGTFSGTLPSGTAGSYQVNLRAVNHVKPRAETDVDFSVESLANTKAPAFTSILGTQQFEIGQSGVLVITASGSPAPSLLIASGTLPSGLVFVDYGGGTAHVQGTPTAGTAGTYPITIRARNGVSPRATTQVITLTVGQAAAATVSSADSATFIAGQNNSFDFTSGGYPPGQMTLSGALPAGMSENVAAGSLTLSGNPPASAAGVYPVTVTASNGIGATASQSFTLYVDGAPAITNRDSFTMSPGVNGTFTITTMGFPAAALSLLDGTLPSGVQLHDNGNGTATLSGTPAAGTDGQYNLALEANNGIGTPAFQGFTLIVAAPQAVSITSADHVTFDSYGENYYTTGNVLTGPPFQSFTITTTGTPLAKLTLESGTIPSGLGFEDHGDGTAVISGQPSEGTQGVYQLVVKATNGYGAVATQSFTLTIADAPVYLSPAATSMQVGVPGSFTVRTHELPAAPLTYTVDVVNVSYGGTGPDLPLGVTFADNGNGTATLSGTPAAGSGGVYEVQVSASVTGAPAVYQTVALTVNDPPAITSADSATMTTGVSNSFEITTTGFPAATIGITGNLPQGITLVNNKNGTATLSGTPASGTNGTYLLTIDASNGISPDAQQSFTLMVNQGAAPLITSADAATFITGNSNSFTVTTTGDPTCKLSVHYDDGEPFGLNFVDNGDGTAILSGPVDVQSQGMYQLTITASNGIGNAVTQVFTLTIDTAPHFESSDQAGMTPGDAASFTVRTTAFPTASLFLIGGTLPSGVTFVDNGDGSGTLSGTPAAGTDGVYDLTFRAKNGISPRADQSFTLTVGTKPVVTSALNATFTSGSPASFTITASGSPTPNIIASEVNLPDLGLTLTDNGNGTATLAGTPTETGVFSFLINAKNSVGQMPYNRFSLTIIPPNSAPAITSTTKLTMYTGVAGTLNVTTSGYPTPAISLLSGTLPSGVTLVDNGNGSATLSGTPASGTAGTHPLVIQAANGVGSNATQTFSLTVDQTETVSINSADKTTFYAGSSGTFTVDASGFPRPTLSVGSAQPTLVSQLLPSGVGFVDNGDGTGTLSGTAAAGTEGTYDVVMYARNSTDGSTSQPFTLTILSPSPAITSHGNPTFTIGTAGSYTVTATGVPTLAISLVQGNLPSGVTYVDNGGGTGILSGTPAAGTAGSYVLIFIAANAMGPDAIQQVVLTVA